MAVRALLFDVFGTLVDWRSSIASAFREQDVARDPEELADEWRSRFWPATQEVVEGKRPWANFDDLHRATLDDLLQAHGIELAGGAREELVQAWRRLEPWPDAASGLEELRRQRPVGALSNGHIALLVDLCRHGKLQFDCLISTELVRSYKPKREVYGFAAELLGLAPDEVMLVAAHPVDLEGARRAGLRSAFVDRPLEYGPGSPPRDDPDADCAVADLHELATRLGPSS